ncbi:hypothetical protein [Bradyrhizobium sp. SSUT77]|uniref:DUF6894 family protein n=1 Tax=Bradyrhizobium sp. SSUT77 TaxID=3040603 RepID=UPI002447C6B9|nr:hypothetical protein [Bradyrhizobium sp. SSUT77]MDH2341551.1 hypothetical protein [Bradyrhizobium sp. SSUT77]
MSGPYSANMPRYFFHVHGVASNKDEEGDELPDDEAAWREASSYAGALLKDIDGKFRPGQEWSLEVTDEAGKPIYFISIGSRKMK